MGEIDILGKQKLKNRLVVAEIFFGCLTMQSFAADRAPDIDIAYFSLLYS